MTRLLNLASLVMIGREFCGFGLRVGAWESKAEKGQATRTGVPPGVSHPVKGNLDST